MIDVFVIRRFYGTEGNNEERAMKSVGRRKRERGKEGCTCFHETKGAIIAAEWMVVVKAMAEMEEEKGSHICCPLRGRDKT